MYHGILNIRKEKGYTSHDVVAKLRGILKQKKIGHTGTLDPEAEGVLPVCLGSATKVCAMLTDQTKTYQTVLKLGVVTDTQDLTGEVIKTQEAALEKERFQAVLAGFTGAIEQIPPMYSARKVHGKKLYELARAGVEIERKARPVTIYSLKVLGLMPELAEVSMEITCSKGTYIRTLCHDMGEAYGCGGAMKSLLRTRVGCFSLEKSLSLEEVKERQETGSLADVLLPVDGLFLNCPAFYVRPEAEGRLRNGNPVNKKEGRIVFYDNKTVRENVCGDVSPDQKLYRMYDSRKNFCALYSEDAESGNLKACRMFPADT